MMEQNFQPSTKPSPWHQHKSVYFVVAIIGILAIGGGVLIAIKNFNTEQDVLSTQVPAECASHGGNAMACSAARNGTKIAATTPGTELKGWQTYSSDLYGFSFQYPNFANHTSIVAQTTDDGTVMLQAVSPRDPKALDPKAATAVNYQFTLFVNNKNLDLKEWFKENLDPQGLLTKNNTYTPTTVGGSEALALTGSAPLEYGAPLQSDIFIIAPSKKYIISFSFGQDNVLDVYGYKDPGSWGKLRDQILSTFKFTK